MEKQIATTGRDEGKDIKKTKKASTLQPESQPTTTHASNNGQPPIPMSQANGSDPISKAIELAIETANKNTDWSLLQLKRLSVSS